MGIPGVLALVKQARHIDTRQTPQYLPLHQVLDPTYQPMPQQILVGLGVLYPFLD